MCLLGPFYIFSLPNQENFFNRGKYSANIIKPGIPKTHPLKMGIRPPIIPIKTRMIPKAILKHV